jgi:VanZ family protein
VNAVAGQGNRRFWLWAAVAAYSGLIFYLSSLSDLHQHLTFIEFQNADKLEHATAYAIWAFLFSAARSATWPRLAKGPAMLLSTLAGVLYGASDEFHQSFVPGRSAELGDLAADAAGSLLGAALYSLWNRLARPSPPPGPERGPS